MSHPIDISIKTILKVALVALAVWIAYLISDILVMIAFAVIITSTVSSWAKKLQNIGVPRMLGVISVYLFFIFVFAGIIYLIIPVLLTEIGNLSQNLPEYYNKGAVYFGISGSEAAKSLMLAKSQDFLISLEDKFVQAGGGVFSLFRNIFSGIISIVIVFVLSFYLSLQEDGIKKFLQFISPREHENYVLGLWQRAQKKLGKWLQGQLLLGFLVGLVVFIGLSILGVPYALVLALFATVMELVPIAGPIIAAVPAILLGFLISPLIGIFTFGFYILIQQTENHIIVPIVMKKAVGLNPVIIILALLIGGKLGGIVGIFLAVPVAAVIMEILSDLGEQNKDILI